MKKPQLLFVLIFIVNATWAQTHIFDETGNAYNGYAVQQITSGNTDNFNTSSVDISCGAGGKFWTVTTPSGAILEWQLSDTTITFLDTLFTVSPIVSLSYCNLLNAGSIQTTLYGSEITTVSWYNGTQWVTITPAQQYSNSGGCGRFLYYMQAESSGSKHLDRFNGSSFTNVVALQNAQFGVADIAVDTSGTIWAFASKVGIGDTLIAFDSTGHVVNYYNISPPIDENNAYGCFLMDSTLYIGIGPANHSYPNTIIPIRIYADTAMEGRPIPFLKDSNFVDMTSCTEPLILAVKNYMNNNVINLYPNPVTNELRIKNEGIEGTEIYNLLGQRVLFNTLSFKEGSGETIDVSSLSSGIYFVKLTGETETWIRKFVKE